MVARTLWPNDDDNNFTYQTMRDEQRAAVYHVFGDSSATAETYDWTSDPQNLTTKSGIYTNVGDAAAYLSGVEDGDTVYTASLTPYHEQELVNFILDGYPVARLYLWVEYNINVTITLENLPTFLQELDPHANGHVNVIKGVNWDEEQGNYVYTVYDPSNGGEILYMTYSQLMFNVKSSGATQQTMELWHPTVSVLTDYADETFMSDILTYDISMVLYDSN